MIITRISLYSQVCNSLYSQVCNSLYTKVCNFFKDKNTKLTSLRRKISIESMSLGCQKRQ